MKKMMMLVDNGPEFGKDRYILKSGAYETATDREGMIKAVVNFFDCPVPVPVTKKRER